MSSRAEIHKDFSSVPSYFSPLDEVLLLAFVLLVELGVEDFGDLIFGFAVNVDWRQKWLDAVRDGVWS